MAKTVKKMPVRCTCGCEYGFLYTAPADMAGKYQCLRCFSTYRLKLEQSGEQQ